MSNPIRSHQGDPCRPTTTRGRGDARLARIAPGGNQDRQRGEGQADQGGPTGPEGRLYQADAEAPPAEASPHRQRGDRQSEETAAQTDEDRFDRAETHDLARRGAA